MHERKAMMIKIAMYGGTWNSETQVLAWTLTANLNQTAGWLVASPKLGDLCWFTAVSGVGGRWGKEERLAISCGEAKGFITYALDPCLIGGPGPSPLGPLEAIASCERSDVK